MHQIPLDSAMGGSSGLSKKQKRDNTTLSNYNAWRTQHIKADLAIDFDNQKMAGTVTLELKRLDEGESKIVLDTR